MNRNYLGKTAFVEYVESGRPLPSPKRPLYCEAFVDLQIVFNSTQNNLIVFADSNIKSKLAYELLIDTC